jgi:hypothetical protein
MHFGRKSNPSGTVDPIVNQMGAGGTGGNGDDEGEGVVIKPVPVILTTGTLAKLIAWVLGPLILFISGGAFWYHKTRVHMANGNIHLQVEERGKLETKAQAKTARKQMLKKITDHSTIKYREIVLDQGEKFQKWCAKQDKKQRDYLDRVMSEVRKTRADVRRAY